MIDIEFYGKKKFKHVRSTWRNYLDIRVNHSRIQNPNEVQNQQFRIDCEKTLIELLVNMGEALGYDFDESHIRQSIYKPEGHFVQEQYEQYMKESLFKLFSGETTLPVSIASYADENEQNEQKELRQLAIQYFKYQMNQQESKQQSNE